VKIAKGLRLGYYRGADSGTWIARRYRGAGSYDTTALGLADDTLDADGLKVFDFWQAQDAARKWAERQRLIEDGIVHQGPYRVEDAVRDYVEEIRPEKKPENVRNAEYTFNAFVLPQLGSLLVDKLTPDRLVRWRNDLAIRAKRVRSKLTAVEPATRQTPDDEDARRKRKASANRILTMLKAALNRAFNTGRASSDAAWRKVKPFRRVDEAVVRYLKLDEVQRLVNACPTNLRYLVQAAVFTGCRYSELARLKCMDVDIANGTLAVRLSKGKVRHVTITNEGLACFAEWVLGKAPNERVFTREDGGAWGKSHQKRPLEQASEVAVIRPHVTFHVLRHTHASHLAMSGVPMGVIAAQLGHADTRMTEKHYAHLAPSYVADTIRANFPALGIGTKSTVVSLRASRVS
jgi:integrase